MNSPLVRLFALFSVFFATQAWVLRQFSTAHTSTIDGRMIRRKPVASPMTDSSDEAAQGVQLVPLDSLTEHEAEGTRMSASIAAWLDAEWMPQEIHVQIGESAKRSYVTCREDGDAEIMSIMMQVASDLTSDWKQYDKDAFVNAWDVANYVSDYLTQRAGVEVCECSTKIY